MAKARNTATHRICPTCDGAGYLTAKPSTLSSPDEEYDVACDHVGCEEGWIRTAPIDPIEELKAARARYIRGWPNRQYAGMRYGEIRQRVVSPLSQPLPHPLIPLYRNVETAIAEFLDGQAERDARAALQNHAFVMDHFNRQLGLAA